MKTILTGKPLIETVKEYYDGLSNLITCTDCLYYQNQKDLNFGDTPCNWCSKRVVTCKTIEQDLSGATKSKLLLRYFIIT